MKSVKKTDKELFALIEQKIQDKNYIFSNHAKQRQHERKISDLDVLNILVGEPRYEEAEIKRRILMKLGISMNEKTGNTALKEKI